jgi:hypothetical protein
VIYLNKFANGAIKSCENLFSLCYNINIQGENGMSVTEEFESNLSKAGKAGYDAGKKYSMCAQLENHGVEPDKALEYVKTITTHSNNIDFCVETIKRIIETSKYNCVSIDTLMELSLPTDNLFMVWDVLFAVGVMGNVGINNINVLGLFVNSYYRNQRRYAKEKINE